MTTGSKTMTTASKEISTETNSAAQEDVKTNLPSLPDAFGEEALLRRFESANKEARAEVPDVTTEQGRKNIKDMARKVAASNKALDTPMRDYLRILKTQPKALEKNARESKERFDSLKTDILKPLAEAQASQDDVISWLSNISNECSSPNIDAESLENIIKTINDYTSELVWPELKKKFKLAHETALTTATVKLERVVEFEEQAARLAELEKQAEAQKKIDNDREVAAAAVDKARIEEQAKAQKDREDVDRRAAESKQREETAKANEAKARRDSELAKEDQEKAAAQAKIDAENERVASEKRQALAVEKAKEDEAKRIADEEAEQAAQAKAREDDKEHRIKINRAAMVDLIAAGINEEVAKNVVRAIARKQVRNISIQY